MLRAYAEGKGPMRSTIRAVVRLIPLTVVCVGFGAMLADLLMRGETGAAMAASAVLSGLGLAVREQLEQVTGWGR